MRIISIKTYESLKCAKYNVGLCNKMFFDDILSKFRNEILKKLFKKLYCKNFQSVCIKTDCIINFYNMKILFRVFCNFIIKQILKKWTPKHQIGPKQITHYSVDFCVVRFENNSA